jgi:hypothetical protein
MKRILTAACRSCVCFVLQLATICSAAAQSSGGQALQKTAMLGTQTAHAGAIMRRFMEPAETRVFWDDPQIKILRNEIENARDFTKPDCLPGASPQPQDNTREDPEQVRGVPR